ncbi:MAG: hypothetical protein IKW21_05710 [Lachnospiraceae bacterium]|nr:hypothetical protein [Lachnospiraceae bacterium]
MKRLFEESRIKQITKMTTVNSMRNAINKMLHETPDVTVLESENDGEEMMIMIKRKGWDNDKRTDYDF